METEGSISKPDEEIKVQIALAPLDSTDMTLVRAWRNDFKIWKWCRQNDLIADVDQAKWFENQSKDRTIKMYKILLSVEKEGDQKIAPVGVCGFTGIDLLNRHAEFNIYLAPAYFNMGIGRKALSILLRHGFENYGFHSIWGEVFDGNPALKTFEKIGFKRDGIRRDFYMREGQFIDAHLISIKEDEWKVATSL